MKVSTQTLVHSIVAILSFAILSNQSAYAAVVQGSVAPVQAVSSSTSASTIQTPQSPYGPMPAQIAQAHTVFLSNTGADANFPVDDIQAYSQVYAALQAWSHYQFVTSPAEADLIFQLHEVAPVTDYTGYHGREYSIASPALQLSIVDPKTNATLWTITSPSAVAGSTKARARWFSIDVTNLVSRVKVVAGQPLTEGETAGLTDVPQTHFARNGLIIAGAVIAVGIAGGLILHHEFENSLSSQKQSQDDFCNANHIPLSECAGG